MYCGKMYIYIHKHFISPKPRPLGHHLSSCSGTPIHLHIIMYSIYMLEKCYVDGRTLSKTSIHILGSRKHTSLPCTKIGYLLNQEATQGPGYIEKYTNTTPEWKMIICMPQLRRRVYKTTTETRAPSWHLLGALSCSTGDQQ